MQILSMMCDVSTPTKGGAGSKQGLQEQNRNAANIPVQPVGMEPGAMCRPIPACVREGAVRDGGTL